VGVAEFAETANAEFGTTEMKHEYLELLTSKFADPMRGVGEDVCIALSHRVRTQPHAPPPPKGVTANERSIVQTVPPGAIWMVTFRNPTPDPMSFLASMSSTLPAVEAGMKKPKEEATPPPPTMTPAIGAYGEPVVWFGDPPFPSVADIILGRLRFHKDAQLVKGKIGGFEAHVYNSGLVVVLTTDRKLGRSILNQFFAVLSRSGVESFSVPDSDLIEVSDIDSLSGDIRGSSMVLTPRNRLARPPVERSIVDQSLVIDASVAKDALAIADTCASNARLAELSLRCFDAFTLARRENYTESFVVGWSIIESHLQSLFIDTLTTAGLSKTRIDSIARDWAASQIIDLCLAVGRLTKETASSLHKLRKTRNRIVHDLAEARLDETELCLNQVGQLVKLPALAVKTKLARL
jgi:hypothetical protein